MATKDTTSTTQETSETQQLWPWIKAVHDIVNQEPWLPEGNKMPVPLLPWLYLSNQRTAERANVLMELGITHVLSTNAMVDASRLKQRLEKVNIQHFYVEGLDMEGYDMMKLHWPKCREVIEQVKSLEGGRLLIHCMAGTNRSGLVACAAVMLFSEHAANVLDAVRFVKAKRGELLSNISFQHQLCRLAQSENRLGPQPNNYTDEPNGVANIDSKHSI